jgi:asparagine synthase (glutamine-hydrolysing)
VIVGVIAPSDRAATHVVESIARGMGVDFGHQSIHDGVAIACTAGTLGGMSCVFGDDHAYLGSLEGDLPAPAVELRGDFAFIGRSSGHLRLARGRFAGRPVYWRRVGSTTVASTRLLPLAIAAGPSLQLDVEHLFALFDPRVRIWSNPPPFAGTRTVYANTVVDIDRGEVTRIHEGPVRLEPELTLSVSETAGAVREEFSKAVLRQCGSARRVAILGGGGVDSSNLLATAVANARRVGAASVVPVALDYAGTGDDRPHLRALCRHLGIEPIRVAPADGSALGLRERVVDCAAHASPPAGFMLAAFARARTAGAEAIFVGEDSELLFNTEGEVFGDFLLSQPLRALRCARRYVGVYETPRQSWRRLVLAPVLRQALPAEAIAWRRRLLRRRAMNRRVSELPWAGPRLQAFMVAEREYRAPAPICSQRERVRRLASSALVMATREFQSRWEIASGLKVSMPYMDDEFVRFMGRISSEAVFSGARERGLLRESMEGLVPDSVRYRTDKARPYLLHAEAFAALDTDALADLLTMRELAAMGIVDAKAFGAAFARFRANPSADESVWGTLWAAITAEAHARWFQSFKAGTLDVAASPEPAAVPA